MTTRSNPCHPADILTPNEARQILGLGPLSDTGSSKGLKPLICEQCGGKIDPETMICEYCDTSYSRDSLYPSIMTEKIQYLKKQNITIKHELDQQRLNANLVKAFRAVGRYGKTL